jgi:hypothetical protein
MNLDSLTFGELKQISAMFGGQSNGTVNPFSEYLGKNVLIRSVTHHYSGKIDRLVGDTAAVLTTAAWVADDGRFHEALVKSEFEEVEPYPNPVMVNWGAVLDVTEIAKLPTEQK